MRFIHIADVHLGLQPDAEKLRYYTLLDELL